MPRREQHADQIAGMTEFAGAERMLFEAVEPAGRHVLDAALPAPAAAVSYVRINRAIAEGKGSPFWQKPGEGRLKVRLPDGTSLPIVFDSSEMLGANRFVTVGRVDGRAGTRVVFAYNDGFLSGSIRTPERAYALRAATAELHQFYEIDPARIGECGGARVPEIDPARIADAARRQAAMGSSTAPAGTLDVRTSAAASGSMPEIHLLMLYTARVKTTLTGGARVAALQSEFDAAVAEVNQALQASEVAARVKLVQIAETTYDEFRSTGDKVQSDALTALYKTEDGLMDEIHALRDRAGADVVCLAVGRSDSSSIGLSFVLSTPASEEASAALFNSEYGFAVVQYGSIAGTDVVAHELGHVLGCAHARGDPGTTGTDDGAYAFSYGYRFYGRNGVRYHDIMAYDPGLPLAYYSNPRVTVPDPVGMPIGVAAGQVGEADCALTIDRNAFEVAGYRLQTQAAPAGTLVNVSTRAFVGTGNQVLIGGFWIGGSTPKRVMVRAAGPALRAFGVTDALPNPTLSVSGAAGVVAGNDNWGEQAANLPTAAEVAAAGAQVQAFPFSGGSADAALLLTLPAGGYTAVVEGQGATGSGLVEVYDLDPSGAKVVNLSTRGYADKGKEMYGGFVVQGAAGTTKRILIRVLGPTLERTFGITGAMNDPMLTLHAASGEVLLNNDDWSTGVASGTVSPTNDFNPRVATYSEKQIAGTGFAPSNRREPCVMVDLSPGNYTVIVRPFELLDGDPPQPAEPGVAIVEVYEISAPSM